MLPSVGPVLACTPGVQAQFAKGLPMEAMVILWTLLSAHARGLLTPDGIFLGLDIGELGCS